MSCPAREFDCAECGIHVVRIVEHPNEQITLCAFCLSVPGWFNDPQLAKTFDPGNYRRPPAHELTHGS